MRNKIFYSKTFEKRKKSYAIIKKINVESHLLKTFSIKFLLNHSLAQKYPYLRPYFTHAISNSANCIFIGCWYGFTYFPFYPSTRSRTKFVPHIRAFYFLFVKLIYIRRIVKIVMILQRLNLQKLRN